MVYGAFLGTFSLAFWIVRHVPRSQTAGIALDLIPYLVIFAIVTWRRSRGHPFFPSAALGLCSGERRSCGFWQPGSQLIRPIGTGLSGRTRWSGESTPSSQTLWKRRLPRNSRSGSHTHGAQRDFPGLAVTSQITTGNARVGRRFFGGTSTRPTWRHADDGSASVRRECASAGNRLRASLPANAELMVRHIYPRIREL